MLPFAVNLRLTGAIVHENTLLFIGSSSTDNHIEFNVLKTSGLSNLPVDLRRCC